MDIYIYHLSRYPHIGSYKFVSKQIETLCRSIVVQFDENALALYHQLLIVCLMGQSINKLQNQNLSENIKSWYKLNFDLILEKIETGRIKLKSYLYPEDRLFKDLGICSLKLIPTGVRKVHLEKVPVKLFLLKRRGRQFFHGLKIILFDLKGIGPLYHGHLDSHDPNSIARFNMEGWVEHFQMIAELLKANTAVKGVQGLACFYDPYLKNISPELSYLSEMITRNGGKLFYIGPSEQATKNAIKLSLKRKKHYQEGNYTPTNYLFVWSRKYILNWARNSMNRFGDEVV